MDNLYNTLYFSEGEVSIQKGSSNLNYKYEPSVNAKGRTVALEYVFHNPMTITQAVSLKSIDDTGVTLSYAYSTSKLTSITSSNTKFELQEVAPDGSRYIYILVTLSTAMPSTFQSNVVWYQGKPGSVTIVDADGVETTKAIVKGQNLQASLVPSNITLNEYGAEWYSDEEYETTQTRIQGGDVYLRVPNLPTDFLELDSSTNTYYVKRGTNTLPTKLVVPAYYNGKPITATKTGTAPFNGDNAFYYTSLDSVDFPNTLIKLGAYSFDSSGVRVIKLPNSLTTIEWQVFNGCWNLTEIFIPKNVSFIDSAIFRGCTNLTTIVVDSANSIYDSRDNCNAIILTAENRLCSGCKTTKIPLSVTRLSANIFYDIPISSIYIHENIANIEPKALADANGLTEIVVSENNPVYDSRELQCYYRNGY